MLTTWHARAIAALVAVAALLGAYGAGRETAPARVVTRENVRVDTQYKDRVVTQVVHDVQVQHDVQTQTRTVTVTRWAKAPDGTPLVTQETHQEAATASATERQAVKLVTTAAEHDAHQVAQETRTVTVMAERPQWSVTALAGGQLGGLRLIPELPAPLVVGAAVERRILGPLSAGLWATSAGAGGVSVRFEF